ncbi:hypothetical protein LIER_33296 [Lithospermum erythrorhizon]|uniref:Uncharacterized protein n=1 Tax=Lithospermum erythrorhizon TaxID=34254 RepID=A0AAV3RY13_LITER
MPQRNHHSNGTTKNMKKNGGNQWLSQNIAPKAWSDQNTINKLGMGGEKRSGGSYDGERNTNINNGHSSMKNHVEKFDHDEDSDEFDEDDEILDCNDDDDDDDDDDYEIDHETIMNKFFKRFFNGLDGLTVEQINDPSRQ